MPQQSVDFLTPTVIPDDKELKTLDPHDKLQHCHC